MIPFKFHFDFKLCVFLFPNWLIAKKASIFPIAFIYLRQSHDRFLFLEPFIIIMLFLVYHLQLFSTNLHGILSQ